ncbi:polysaccharide lyase 8 family protein [Clostridium gasigenes]|uniref:Hyaluronate lyase n=1 Tax=Clostridium gasigenes TaxID=94869 RepID=A0A7X0SDS5_9CLOT|nr:polysaccharide lyase family 8 super-sandwich domain-containing protein [Clostridium gasigenes]MBB6714488.1 hypothetical protein [Clostridium gasigenes]
MNRKKLEKIIITALVGVFITNATAVNVVAFEQPNNQSTKIENNIITKVQATENVLIDEKFNSIYTETDNSFKQFYENEIRTKGWQIRKWSGAIATATSIPYGRIVKDTNSNGGQYFEIECRNTVGFFQPDDYTAIKPDTEYSLSSKVKTSGITSKEPISIRVEIYDDAKKVIERKDLHKISEDKEWTDYTSTIKTTNQNAKYMKIIYVFGNVNVSSLGATGKFAVDTLLLINNETTQVEIDNVQFESNEVKVGVGQIYIPKGIVLPVAATEKYSLSSSDIEIANVKDEKVYAVKGGSVTIMATSESGKNVGSFNVNVKAINTEAYDKAIGNIFETLVPNSIIDKSDLQMIGIINTAVSHGDKYWKSLNRNLANDYLWADVASTTNSADVTTNYNRLYDMAVAYVMEGSRLKGNTDLLSDITYGLEWMKTNRYDGKKYYNNWWDFEVGAPQKLNSILMLIKDKLTYEQIIEYTNIIDSYVKDPTMHTQGKYPSIGANRADMCKVVIYSGLLSGNEQRIKLGVKELDILFKYVDDVIDETGSRTDGYYKDGSWIEHGSIPYAGSYGAVLVGGVGEIAHVLAGTEWSIPQEKMNIMYEVILDSFEPLIYKGSIMNMVSGRSISRDNEKDYGHGFGFMRRVLAFYTETATVEYKNRFKSMIKEWISSNNVRDIVGNSTNLQFTAQIKELMNDESIKARGELIGNYNFANMDRVVHRRPGYVFGLSMYSSRVSNYESLNGENLKGYHTADGMTYLYNGDIEQYAGDFWATVDSKRLPGTTVDTKDIFKDLKPNTSYGPGETAISTQDWVGGATLGDYGVAGMYLDNKRINPAKDLGMDLEAKKSYFMFDDEIVALGAGITSTKDNGVETIVENRVINKNLDKIYINGQNVTDNINEETKIEDAKWIYLEGNVENSSIGYYFPKGSSINVKKDTRTGAWKDINTTKTSTLKTDTYFTMWNNHGINPKNDTYEYVILPNMSKDEVKAYSSKSDIKVIINNENVQAVKENNKNIVAANFWNNEETVVKRLGLKVNGKASVIMKEIDGVIDISISDPTMKNTGSITVELEEELKEVISKDENVKIENINGKTLITVNVNDSTGQSFKAKFVKVIKSGENPDSEKSEKPKK